MTRGIKALLTVAILLLGAISILAHDEVRVIGIVTKKQDASISVKNKAGQYAVWYGVFGRHGVAADTPAATEEAQPVSR